MQKLFGLFVRSLNSTETHKDRLNKSQINKHSDNSCGTQLPLFVYKFVLEFCLKI